MTQSEFIELIKISSTHWELSFNRPDKYNAITADMYECITQILDDAANDEQLILLSFTGKGKFYSSGTDLADPAKALVKFCFLFLF
jgi:enoyl-CoA hydratase/carnithine racemase